jgi:hypothetical protein
MRFNLRLIAHATFASIMLAGTTGTAATDELPDYMQPIAGRTTSTPAETATKNLLALNSSMFELYGDAAKVFQKNILSGPWRTCRPGRRMAVGSAPTPIPRRSKSISAFRPRSDGTERS